ncbi:MAG: alpha/beta fold hydrolase [Phycisphaerales bacterium]
MNAPTAAVRAIAAAIVLLVTAPLALAAPEVWSGELVTPSAKLVITIHLEQDGDAWTGTGDVLAQGLSGAPLADIEVSDGHMKFRMTLPGATVAQQPIFDLTRDGDTATGTMSQGGATLPITMKRVSEEELAAAAAERRPQTPRPPFPYRTMDVRVPSPSADAPTHELAGTLTLPDPDEFGPGPYPCVVTISGTGPQDRDETIFEHKPFLVIADHLARRGVASLRCDDRGVGASGGDYRAAGCTDFAADARAQVEYLLTRDEIDHDRIGLIGHSEGGLTAPMVAAGNEHVAFVVLLAGMSVRGDEILTSQSAAMFKLQSLPESFITESNELRQSMLDAIREGLDDEVKLDRMRALVQHDTMGMATPEQVERQARLVLAQFDNKWGRELVTLDARDYLSKMTQPVLALNGSLDTQVLPELNLGAVREALAKAGNTDVTAIELPGLNHLFQHASNGSMGEYAEIKETFDPEALKMIGDWVVERFVEPAGG